MSHRPQRQRRIVEVIRRHRVRSQRALAEHLAKAGISATQATLSRDLHELGVAKGPDGYVLPDETANGNGSARRLESLRSILRSELTSVTAGGTTIVLRTRPGLANALAVEIDRAQLPGVLGTVAGDDTIFVATSSTRQRPSVARTLRELAG